MCSKTLKMLSKSERKQNTEERIGRKYAAKRTEIPPLILDGAGYCSDIRTPPSSVRKIPFLKIRGRQKGGEYGAKNEDCRKQ